MFKLRMFNYRINRWNNNIIFVILLLITLIIGINALSKCRKVEKFAFKDVHLERLKGHWNILYTNEPLIDGDCSAIDTHTNGVNIDFEFHMNRSFSVSGQFTSCNSKIAKCFVTFRGIRRSTVWILDTDYNDYLLIYSCHKILGSTNATEKIRILGHNKTVSETTMTRLLTILNDIGGDVDLHPVNHDVCNETSVVAGSKEQPIQKLRSDTKLNIHDSNDNAGNHTKSAGLSESCNRFKSFAIKEKDLTNIGGLWYGVYSTEPDECITTQFEDSDLQTAYGRWFVMRNDSDIITTGFVHATNNGTVYFKSTNSERTFSYLIQCNYSSSVMIGVSCTSNEQINYRVLSRNRNLTKESIEKIGNLSLTYGVAFDPINSLCDDSKSSDNKNQTVPDDAENPNIEDCAISVNLSSFEGHWNLIKSSDIIDNACISLNGTFIYNTLIFKKINGSSHETFTIIPSNDSSKRFKFFRQNMEFTAWVLATDYSGYVLFATGTHEGEKNKIEILHLYTRGIEASKLNDDVIVQTNQIAARLGMSFITIDRKNCPKQSDKNESASTCEPPLSTVTGSIESTLTPANVTSGTGDAVNQTIEDLSIDVNLSRFDGHWDLVKSSDIIDNAYISMDGTFTNNSLIFKRINGSSIETFTIIPSNDSSKTFIVINQNRRVSAWVHATDYSSYALFSTGQANQGKNHKIEFLHLYTRGIEALELSDDIIVQTNQIAARLGMSLITIDRKNYPKQLNQNESSSTCGPPLSTVTNLIETTLTPADVTTVTTDGKKRFESCRKIQKKCISDLDYDASVGNWEVIWSSDVLIGNCFNLTLTKNTDHSDVLQYRHECTFGTYTGTEKYGKKGAHVLRSDGKHNTNFLRTFTLDTDYDTYTLQYMCGEYISNGKLIPVDLVHLFVRRGKSIDDNTFNKLSEKTKKIDLKLVRSNRTCSVTDSPAHSTESPAHSTESSVHFTESSVHSTKSLAHSTESPAHSTESPAHFTESPVHSTKSLAHSTESPAHSTESSVHSTKSLAYSTESPAHSTESPAHSTKSLAHSTETLGTTLVICGSSPESSGKTLPPLPRNCTVNKCRNLNKKCIRDVDFDKLIGNWEVIYSSIALVDECANVTLVKQNNSLRYESLSDYRLSFSGEVTHGKKGAQFIKDDTKSLNLKHYVLDTDYETYALGYYCGIFTAIHYPIEFVRLMIRPGKSIDDETLSDLNLRVESDIHMLIDKSTRECYKPINLGVSPHHVTPPTDDD